MAPPGLAWLSGELGEAGVRPLLLRAGPGLAEGASAAADRGIQLVVAPAEAAAAIRVLEPLSWRYSWLRSGMLRLLPRAYYWWDGGTYVELYWGLPAAPLPSAFLRRLTSELWRSAAPGPTGLLEPAPAAWMVHHAVQALRPGPDRDDDWDRFCDLYAMLGAAEAATTVARQSGVGAGLRRAMAAGEHGAVRPAPGALFDGWAGMAWQLGLAISRAVRPRRLGRVLSGTPVLGDAPIRCRVAGTEVRAGPGVFVPTPDADLFVDMARQRIEALDRPIIVDVGTGCGAIAIALAAERADADVHATEIDRRAVRWARANARRLGLERVSITAGSLLAPLPDRLAGRTDVLIANLPFYPERDNAAIGSVPRDTIQGPGADGLALLRQLVRDARRLLRPGGWLLLQMFDWQWEILSPELRALGYRPDAPRLSGPFAICPAELTNAPTDVIGDS